MKPLPNPMGCRLCGIDQRYHGIQAAADGSHAWTRPTEEQIKARMRARREGPEEPERDELTCRASQYASLSDTYDGRTLCGCLNCIEYVADRESEDQV